MAIDMTAADKEFLARHSGVGRMTRQQLADLDARSTARITAEATLAYSRTQVAELLKILPSRVSERVSAGQLYSYPGPGRRPMFPDWQIVSADHNAGTDGRATQKARVVPHLSRVLENIPAGAHPVAVRSFMITPTQELTSGQGDAMSPADWLLSGGDVAAVAEMAATLGEQV